MHSGPFIQQDLVWLAIFAVLWDVYAFIRHGHILDGVFIGMLFGLVAGVLCEPLPFRTKFIVVNTLFMVCSLRSKG